MEKIKNGDEYESNDSGKFIVIDYKKSTSVRVMFVDTGFETVTQSSHIRRGLVKDKMRPRVYGVGFTGEGKHKTSVGGKHTKCHKVWQSMLARCYSEKYQDSFPTYIGCYVCDEWHNFQNFAKWFEVNYIEGFHLDKDKITPGNKKYSPETCSFISTSENISISSESTYTFTNPNGVKVKVINLTKFCRENGLRQSSMHSVYTGRYKQHKGWTV